MKQETDRAAQIQSILKISDRIYRGLQPGLPPDWLSSDLTIAQLRVLLVLHTEGALRMSALASILSVALSTATGITDKLVSKGLVSRHADEQDRRLVIIELSETGRRIVNGIWESGRAQIQRLLEGLSDEQLPRAEELARMLLQNFESKKK
jgi:DNA-binding MarR family transcriptional regulator